MDNILELGTDIDGNWEFDEKGDLKTITNDKNLIQAINNRLNTRNGELDIFYSEYGSFLHNFLGWKRTDETLEFMRVELEKALSQDPRLKDFSINLEYNEDGAIQLTLNIHFMEDSDLNLSFIITGEEVINITGE